MKANNLGAYEFNATMLSQIEGWREKATRRFKAQLINEQELVNCMRWLDKLEESYENAELSLVGLYDEAPLEEPWSRHRRAKAHYNWQHLKKLAKAGVSNAK